MSVLRWAKQQFHQRFGEPAPKRNPRLRDDPEVLHVGNRSYSRRIETNGKAQVKKCFTTETPGRTAFAAELRARREFGDMPWFTPWTAHGRYWFAAPMYPSESRLDRLAPTLSGDERAELAGQSLSIILDLLVAGFAHRDFHAGNLFLVDGQIRLVDYETLAAYPEGRRPGLRDCYDVTGQGLDSPWQTRNMCYANGTPLCLADVLNVDFESALIWRIRRWLSHAIFLVLPEPAECQTRYRFPGPFASTSATTRSTARSWWKRGKTSRPSSFLPALSGSKSAKSLRMRMNVGRARISRQR